MKNLVLKDVARAVVVAGYITFCAAGVAHAGGRRGLDWTGRRHVRAWRCVQLQNRTPTGNPGLKGRDTQAE